MMNLIEEIRKSWGWTGLEPVAVVGENEFGNLIIKDSEGRYWRLCPEECYCKVVANNREELDLLSADQDFLRDWYMQGIVELANQTLGPLAEDRKYCLKLPAILGGAYDAENLATAPLSEIVGLSGVIAQQIKDLPDGASITLQVVD